jgi:hypothetical protein
MAEITEISENFSEAKTSFSFSSTRFSGVSSFFQKDFPPELFWI